MFSFSNFGAEDACSCIGVRQLNVDTFLEPTSNGAVELPWHVGGSKHKNSVHVVADSLHLDQEFGLNSPARVVFTFRTGAAKRVDFIDEDDARLLVAGHLK